MWRYADSGIVFLERPCDICRVPPGARAGKMNVFISARIPKTCISALSGNPARRKQRSSEFLNNEMLKDERSNRWIPAWNQADFANRNQAAGAARDQYALANKRKSVTLVHKGTFRNSRRSVPGLGYDLAREDSARKQSPSARAGSSTTTTRIRRSRPSRTRR